MENIKYSLPSGFDYSHSSEEIASEKLHTKHCHDSYEILYVVSGKGKYLIEGAKFNLAPRTLVLIKPFEYHCVEVNAETCYERYVIHFSENDITEEIKDVLKQISNADGGDSGSFYSSGALSQATVSIFERFKQVEELKAGERDTYAKLLLSELIFLLSATGNQPIAHDEYKIGARVAKYINEFLDKDVSLDIIAKRFFISKYYLCRLFKSYSGVSIHAYISQKRVFYAKQLIEAGETASGAAYKVGFGDYSAFYRAYVKALGKPPTSKGKKK